MRRKTDFRSALQSVRGTVLRYRRAVNSATGLAKAWAYGYQRGTQIYNKATLYGVTDEELFKEWSKSGLMFETRGVGWMRRTSAKAPERVAHVINAGAFKADPLLSRMTVLRDDKKPEFAYVSPQSMDESASVSDLTVHRREIPATIISAPVEQYYSEVDLVDVMYEKLGESFAKAIIDALINGKSSSFTGIIEDSMVRKMDAKEPGKLGLNDLYNMTIEARDIKNAALMMSPRRYNELMYACGNMACSPLSSPYGGLPTAFGIPITVMPYVPDGYVIIGDSSAFAVSRLHNIDFARHGKPLEDGGMRATARVYMCDLKPGSFLVLKL